MVSFCPLSKVVTLPNGLDGPVYKLWFTKHLPDPVMILQVAKERLVEALDNTVTDPLGA